MFLKNIELVNFKCHASLYLSFDSGDGKANRKTTFLLGENGTGKSALLKAVALVTAGSSALSDLLGNPDDWVKNGKQYCEIQATLTTAQGEERPIRFRIDRGVQLKTIIERNTESLDLIDKAIGHADRSYFVVAYGASRRLNQGSQFLSGAHSPVSSRSASTLSLFNPDIPLVSLSNWAMDLDYSGKGDGIRTVRRALDAFLFENIRFKSIDKLNRLLIFSTPDGDVPLGQLSDGYQNVASWVGDLMFRINETFKDHKDPLRARGLLLIDEIDLHLHPRWQRQLHDFLTKKLPNFQVIATTHSPLTAQQANEGELYALRRDRKKVELIPFRGAPNKMLLHQLLMSPLFGLDTDESVKVEVAKSHVRNISLKKRKSSADKAALVSASETLEDTSINIRSNGLLDSNDLKLLKTINSELKSKK